MEEQQDDLMKNIAGSNNNMKKYLIIGGATFVIFVVGIIIAKFAFGTPKDNTQVILPPDTTSNNQKDAADLFNSIKIEKSDDTTNKKEELKQDKNLNNIPKVTVKKDDVNTFKKPEPIAIETPTEKAKTEIKISKPTIEKKEIKPVEHTTKKHYQIKQTVGKNYYIQVAAFTRGNPSPKFLGLIKQNGFHYKIVEANLNGKTIKRVLIGGFTVEEAKQNLVKVKEKITTSAFIKRLK